MMWLPIRWNVVRYGRRIGSNHAASASRPCCPRPTWTSSTNRSTSAGTARLARAGAYRDIDVLVNNVGHYIRPTAFLDGDDDHWDALDAVNLRHVFRCTKAFAPSMVERGSGAIVNVSSVEGLRGYPADPAYGAYKAAVAHFTRCLALELAPRG